MAVAADDFVGRTAARRCGARRDAGRRRCRAAAALTIRQAVGEYRISLAVAPDDSLALVALEVPRNLIPETQIHQGWMVTYGLGVVETGARGSGVMDPAR